MTVSAIVEGRRLHHVLSGGGRVTYQRWVFVGLLSLLLWSPAFAADDAGSSSHEGHASSSSATGDKTLPSCGQEEETVSRGLESVQIETSDITLYERFFDIVQAPVIEQHEHPGRDRVKGYCYRGISIVVRQDLQHPRPTGWVQLNFTVQDAAVLQQGLERLLKESPVAKLQEGERNSIIRFRLKPDVKRGERKAIRLEVFGPEGFMIGFNQYK